MRDARAFAMRRDFSIHQSRAGTRCGIDRTETKHIETTSGASAPRWGALHSRESLSTAPAQSNFRMTVRRGNSANAAVPRRGQAPRHEGDTSDWCTGVMKCERVSHLRRHIRRIEAVARLSTGDMDSPFGGTNSRGVRHVFGQRKSLTSQFSRAYRRPHSRPASRRSDGSGGSASRHR